jgi:hypothetical protein
VSSASNYGMTYLFKGVARRERDESVAPQRCVGALFHAASFACGTGAARSIRERTLLAMLEHAY